jgi:hypothetical protein
VPLPALLARVCRFYGQPVLDRSAYPTSDGYMPAALFDVLLAEMPAAVASDQLRAGTAVAHGAAMVMADKKDTKVKRFTKDLEDAAERIVYDYPSALPDAGEAA